MSPSRAWEPEASKQILKPNQQGTGDTPNVTWRPYQALSRAQPGKDCCVFQKIGLVAWSSTRAQEQVKNLFD